MTRLGGVLVVVIAAFAAMRGRATRWKGRDAPSPPPTPSSILGSGYRPYARLLQVSSSPSSSLMNASVSPTPTATLSPGASPSNTATGSPTPTSTVSPSSTSTPTPTATLSPGASPSVTATNTPSLTPSPTPSVSPGTVFSAQGCPCLSQCQDSITTGQQWCFTSETGVDPPPANNIIVFVANSPSGDSQESSTFDDVNRPCGFYSAQRTAYWDYACSNGTAVMLQLTTATEVWSHITNSAVVTSTALYALFGAVAARRLAFGLGAPLLGLISMLAMAAYGALATFVLAAVISIPLAQVYLAMPYALSSEVAITTGVSLGWVACYLHVGQHIPSIRPFSD